MKATIVLKGGQGSGHFGHSGIPGKQGGSLPGDGIVRHAVPGQAEQVVVDPKKRELSFDYPIDKKAEAHLNQSVGGRDIEWSQATLGRRAEIKKDIIGDLSDESGFAPDKINNAIAQWAETSNSADLRSLSLQEAASEEFGSSLSEWQTTRLSEVRTGIEFRKNNGFQTFETHAPVNNWSREQERTFLRAVYSRTQEQLSAAGFKPDDTISLYRGFGTEVKFSVGNKVDYTGNAMESWSVSNNVATNFTGGRGIAITTQVRVRDILCTARTGFGCLEEGEFVVLGNSKGIQATVTEGNDYYD